MAAALEGEADGSHKRHCGDEVPESEEVRRARARAREGQEGPLLWAGRRLASLEVRAPCSALGCSLLPGGPLALLPAVLRVRPEEWEGEMGAVPVCMRMCTCVHSHVCVCTFVKPLSTQSGHFQGDPPPGDTTFAEGWKDPSVLLVLIETQGP